MYSCCLNRPARIPTDSGETSGLVGDKVMFVPDAIGTPDDIRVLSGAASRVGSPGTAT